MRPQIGELVRLVPPLFVQAIVLFGLPLAITGRVIVYLFKMPRISYWTGTPILTLAQKAVSERLLGQPALSVVRSTYHISKDFDVVLSRWCAGQRWLLYPVTGAAFLIMLATASRVHTFADGGLLPSLRRRGQVSALELLSYRLFGIPHFVWTYGADVRTRERTLALGPNNCCTDCTQIRKACICDDEAGNRNIVRLKNNGSIIFSMGDMIEYTPGSRNDLFFWPLDLSGVHEHTVDISKVSGARPLRVVHAPNHREFKGTRYLESAIQALQAEGVSIELVLVEKMSNQQALNVYRTADVIFDQCLIGFHGYFALEAMALGKPVMCYIRKPNDYLLCAEECPIINTHVDTLKDDLYRLALAPESLPVIGRKGREYVERHYSRAAFAARLQRAYYDLGVLK